MYFPLFISNATLTHTIEWSHQSALQSSAKYKAHDDFDVTIIWNNIHSESDFLCFRKESCGPIERILGDFARVLESGVFEEVVSLNASKHLLCVVVICSKNQDEDVIDSILSVH
ncbi:uncharacterized protein K460DRAFT_433418 [Cucurbitaria berberidis CBS 394.84]|uniref:Uncharacterized protein n=1 Tax=Cucurbitaria berberidis CBS 394.84 TaxID=1168544 RepID=A0A9P4L6D9_9PLEO|nr:uncharacterized protein K460DRAFT_433418 [Cucurbitaria berberidis CBS 394.84]KAF1843710.1 hypothetical protein K460DRAFT_433418 [Cucurbitaria berberidis CBS 394.84]